MSQLDRAGSPIEWEAALHTKEQELALARAHICELQEAYRDQTQELARWKAWATQLEAEVTRLRQQWQWALARAERAERQNRVLKGIFVGAGFGIVGLGAWYLLSRPSRPL
jgi:chromosome segregation ATPase